MSYPSSASDREPELRDSGHELRIDPEMPNPDGRLDGLELYDAIVQLCQQYGRTTEETYELIHHAIDSIDTSGSDIDDESVRGCSCGMTDYGASGTATTSSSHTDSAKDA